jgi:IPT/TIG domain
LTSTPFSGGASTISYFDPSTLLAMNNAGQGEMVCASASLDLSAAWDEEGDLDSDRRSPGPIITQISPSKGLVGVGTVITIAGVGFTGATVSPDPTASIVVSNVIIQDDQHITATVTPNNSINGGGNQSLSVTVKNRSTSAIFFGQIPTSVRVLSASVSTMQPTANGCPASNVNSEGPFGMKAAVRYQILDQRSPAQAIFATMQLRENLVDFVVDDQPQANTISGGFVTPSGTTNSDGTFLDDPLGACGQGPFSTATFTQTLFVLLSPQISPVIRTSNFSETGKIGCGSFGNGTDISITVGCP